MGQGYVPGGARVSMPLAPADRWGQIAACALTQGPRLAAQLHTAVFDGRTAGTVASYRWRQYAPHPTRALAGVSVCCQHPISVLPASVGARASGPQASRLALSRRQRASPASPRPEGPAVAHGLPSPRSITAIMQRHKAAIPLLHGGMARPQSNPDSLSSHLADRGATQLCSTRWHGSSLLVPFPNGLGG